MRPVAVLTQVSDRQPSTTLYSRVREVASKHVMVRLRQIRNILANNSISKKEKAVFDNCKSCIASDISFIVGEIILEDLMRTRERERVRVAVRIPRASQV
jgi:hypothetical protein